MKSKKYIYFPVIGLIVAIILTGIIIGIYQIHKHNEKSEKNVEVNNEELSDTSDNDVEDEEKDSENKDSQNESTQDSQQQSEDSEVTSDTTPETQQQTTQQTIQESSSENVTQEIYSPFVPKDNSIDPARPMVALTFDDGPGEYTNSILDILQQYGAHATFFVVGSRIESGADVISRAASIGCEIGNHTMSHGKLTGLDANALASEIDPLSNRIRELTGQQQVLLRPPYGAIDDFMLAQIKDPIILWSVDTMDWKTRNTESTIQNIQTMTYDGAVILMHDIHGETAAAVPAIVEWLNASGYQMVTVSELGYYRRGGLKNGIKYGSFK